MSNRIVLFQVVRLFLHIGLCFFKKAYTFALALEIKLDGTLAQLVEHRTENPGVPGSIPGGTTQKASTSCRGFSVFKEILENCSFGLLLVDS